MSTTPTNPVVEVLIDGVWVDVADDCRLGSADSGGGISIKRGRPNEAPAAEVTEADFTLNNGPSAVASTLGQAGVYTELNPNSPYFGKIGRNQPVRIGLNRVQDLFTRTAATDEWGRTPDWVDTELVTHTGQTWNLTGTASNFDLTGTAATLQAATGFQAGTFGTYADVDIKTKVRVSNRTSEFGVVARMLSNVPTQGDGTFESGVADWTGTGVTLVSSTAQVRFGSKSALMTVTGSPTTANMRAASNKRIEAVATRSYKVRCWVRMSTTNNVFLSFAWYDASQALLSTSTSGGLAVTANTWTLVEYTVSAPANTAFAGHGVGFFASPPNGTTMYVDGMVAMRNDESEYYTAYITPSGTDLLRIGRVSPGTAQANSVNLSANVATATDYWFHVQVRGQRIRANFWADSGSEPSTWMITYYDNTVPVNTPIAMAGEIGLFAKDGNALVTFAEIEVNQWRAHAEIVQLPPRWDLSRQDKWVNVQGRGILRRLGQGRKALESAVKLHLKRYTPSAGWLPLEAAYTENLATNAIPGAGPGSAVGVTYNSPDLTGELALPGVAGYAHLDDDTSYVTLYAQSYANVGAWTVLCFFRIPANPVGSDILLFTYTTTGTARYFHVYLQTDGAARIEARTQAGALLDSSTLSLWGFVADMPVGCWLAATLYILQDGGNVDWAWNYHRPGFGGAFYSHSGTYAGTIGAFRTFHAGSSSVHSTAGGTSICHVFHYAGDLPFVTNAFALAAAAYATETTTTRFGRLCGDAGIPFGLFFTAAGVRMGAQLPALLMDLLEECAVVEHGLISEARDAFELELWTRPALYLLRTTSLDIDAGHITAPLDPTPDDQATRNNVTVRMPGGAFAASIQETGPLNINPPETDPQGVGDYPESPEINFNDVEDLQSAADWRRSLGTIPDPRYPGFTVNMASSVYQQDPTLAAEVASLDTGRMIRLTNVEVSPDEFDQLINGYTERLDQYEWLLTLVASPGTVYSQIGTVEYTTRVSSAGSQTAASFVSGTNTALSVERVDSSTMLWVRTVDDPEVTGFDIKVSGVILSVVSISGTSDPQTITVVQTPVNGVIKTIPAGELIELVVPWRIAW